MNAIRRSIAAAALGLAAAVVAGADGRELRAIDLDGDEETIPLHPEHGALLIVGFSRESSSQTMAWGQRIAEHRREQAEAGTEDADPVPVVNVLVFGDISRMMRGFLRRMMKGAIPKEAEDSFYLVYKGAEAWRDLAAVEDEDAAYVLRLDAGGNVCARHVGPVADRSLAVLLGDSCGAQSAPAT